LDFEGAHKQLALISELKRKMYLRDLNYNKSGKKQTKAAF
jgi:hypothetical protein